MTTAGKFLPVELVFNPNWWYRTAGISFDEPFYFDAETRIRNDVAMRCVLYERYGDLGLGEADPQPRPIIGSLHVAGGFVIPALLGAEIIFAPDAFLNLRLSPVRMLQCTPREIAGDTEKLLRAAGRLEQVGVCCINMDYGTPDDNIFAMFEVVQRYRRYGA